MGATMMTKTCDYCGEAEATYSNGDIRTCDDCLQDAEYDLGISS
jgi:uncharacterized Zn finger protein (UPF0148 family)